MSNIGSYVEELRAYQYLKEKAGPEPSKTMENILKKALKRVESALMKERENKPVREVIKRMPEKGEPYITELKPAAPAPTGAVYELTPMTAPPLDVVEMKAQGRSRSELPRLRKKLMGTIDMIQRSGVGLRMDTYRRMMRQAETGKEVTLRKLEEEIKDKAAEAEKALSSIPKLKSKSKKQ